MTKHLIYVTYGQETSSVYATQVIELLNTWIDIEDTWKITLIQISDSEMFEGLDERVNRIHVKRKAKFLLNKHKNEYVTEIYSNLNHKEETHQSIFFNSRGSFAYSIITEFIKKYNIKCKINNLEVRGITEELKYSISRFIAYPILDYYERKVVRAATSISTVSENLKDYLIQKYKISSKRDFIKVIPTLSIMDFYKAKKDKKDMVFIGNVTWIKQKEFIKKVLFLNKNLSKLGWKISIIGNSNRIQLLEDQGVEFLNRMSPKELSEKVINYHSGLIIRDDSIVNKVAAPCKVADYLCQGMPIVYSGDIGSIKDFTKKFPKTKDLIVDLSEIKNENDLLNYMKISEDQMKELSEKAKTYFGAKSVVNSYLEFFNKDGIE